MDVGRLPDLPDVQGGTAVTNSKVEATFHGGDTTIPNGHCGGVLVHDPHVWEGDKGPRSCVGTIPSPGGSR